MQNTQGKQNIITWIKRIILVLSACYLLYLIGLILWAASYSVPVSDDFVYALQLKELHVARGGTYLGTCFAFMAERYLNWQGTYTSMFLQALLSPMNQGGFRQLKLVMLSTDLLFFVTILLLLRQLLKTMGMYGHTLYAVLSVILVHQIAALGTWREVFFWFSGAASYSMPAIMLMWAMIFLLRDTRGEGIGKWMIAAGALGFLAMGGTLVVSAIGCWLMVVWNLNTYFREKKTDKYGLLLLGIWVAGAIINALAPGNFIRQAAENNGHQTQILRAITDSISVIQTHLEWLLHGSTVGIVLIGIFVIGIFLSKQTALPNCKHLITALLLLLTPFVAVFPVVYGYGLSWMPSRCTFLIMMTELFCYGNLALLLGRFAGQLLTTEENRRQTVMILAVVCVGFSFSCDVRPADYTYKQLAITMREGTIPDHYVYVRELLEGLSERQGEDIVADVPEFVESIPNYYCFSISDDPDNNGAIADLYGVHSIRRGKEQLN